MNAPANIDHSALCSIELEQEILGAVLVTNSALEIIEREVSAEDFSEPLHGQLFETLEAMAAPRPTPHRPQPDEPRQGRRRSCRALHGSRYRRRPRNRYEYLDEKRAAFESLAGLVALILDPPAGN
jgi:DnaB helicase-like protein